ncbi:glycosyltransferase [Lacinutrix neustonica]|uniref:Glycosyltransferase n=1 Tax=Lacinutrix neustonica TaxID=2980107 RepID=A0A9E8MVU8_9FLAO|nr:glycosyltransferase [Lacinutrix neustonica]WAC02438.1 glycosyltransferase [Lacinutrix neustonica]
MIEFIRYGLDYFFFGYGIALFLCYFGFVLLAIAAIKSNAKRAEFLNVNDIKGANDLPSVSLIAPAYNEGKSIIINVKSLLSIQYPYYELIIVNDGSKDDSLEQLIKEFSLEKAIVPQVSNLISHAKVRDVYQSKDLKYKHLTVIDKDNGGRADALNCGITYANTNLVLCTDADCIIEQDALLKMVRPYLEEIDREVIACGGAIGIANDSIIKNGTLKELRLPKNIVARIQVVEYIRAFLLGRMAWTQMNGLLLVSGAFGLYPRQRVLEVGGFDHATVGEDLELCIRLRAHMERLKKPYDVVYIPETLCWTEAPASFKVYITQRDRWARGLWETIKKHKYLFYNRKYRATGMLFFPYWVYFELGAPIVEFLGLIYLIVCASLGIINWPFAIALFAAVYLIGCIFSTVSILLYTVNFKHYAKPSMVIKLLLAAYLESFVTHPVMVFAEMKGYFKKIFGIKSTWGTMSRKGFTTIK